MRFTDSLAAVLACSVVIGLVSTVDPSCQGQEKIEKVILDPAKAGAEFDFQGEYLGELTLGSGKVKLGVQVVSEPSGKFFATGYAGGLPGEGWSPGAETRFVADSRMIDGSLMMTGAGDIEVKVKDGFLTIIEDGRKIGECKKVVRKSSTLGARPPEGAAVLFDGSAVHQFTGAPAKDQLLDGDLLVQGVVSKPKFQNFTLHIEFMLSYMPEGKSQGRSNSGCYSQGRYEVQILDSFGLKGENNECGGIYGIKKPDVNMCYPPLSWQTYDIDFTAAKYDPDGKKTENSRMTVKHNGVLIHRDVELPKTTTAAPVSEGAEPGPIFLQDHKCPVRFRNIWVVEKK